MQFIQVYMVTIGNSDGSIFPGDHIFYHEDGSLSVIEDKGWFEKEELSNKEVSDFSCVKVSEPVVLKNHSSYLILPHCVRGELVG